MNYISNLNTVKGQSLTDKCLVMDLDECLVHSYDTPFIQSLKIYTNPQLITLRRRVYRLPILDIGVARGTGNIDYIEGIRRPHLDEFLTFAFGYFKIVAGWSAGKQPYVQSAFKRLFSNIRPAHVVYTYSDLKFDENGYDKPLEKMITEVPGLSNYMNLNNTLIIDDRGTNFRSNPDNGIKIPIYSPKPNISDLMADDLALLQLQRWLLQPEVIQSSDVKTLDKSNIFKTTLDQYPVIDYSLTPVNQVVTVQN